MQPKITDSDSPPDGVRSLSLPGERWRHIGERYWISDMGRIASTAYRGTEGVCGVLTPAADPKGYMRTMILLGGRYRTVKVHRLVAKAWIGPIHGMTVNHKNFDRADNRACNLEIVTQGDNVRYSSSRGRYGKSIGSINGNSKLDDQDIKAMRKMRAEGTMVKKIAEVFGVSRLTVRRILQGTAWSHVA